MTYASAWAHKVPIWVVTTDNSAIQRQVADTLVADVERTHPGAVQWAVFPAQQRISQTSTPRLVITVGSGALASVVSEGISGNPAILATLLPRAAFERELGRATQKMTASAILLDQPPARQSALIRVALPAAQTIGLLVGPESRKSAAVFRAALAEQGLEAAVEDVTQRGLFAALQNLLEESHALLALPDPAVFNGDSVSNVLTASYRRKVPLLAFSPAYVRAGALLGLYAAPEHVARAGADAVRMVLAGLPLPAPAAPREYSIEVNSAVARSLGLVLNEDELRRQMAGRERRP